MSDALLMKNFSNKIRVLFTCPASIIIRDKLAKILD